MRVPLKNHSTVGHGSASTLTGTVTMVPKSRTKSVPTSLSLTAPIAVSSKARAVGIAVAGRAVSNHVTRTVQNHDTISYHHYSKRKAPKGEAVVMCHVQ